LFTLYGKLEGNVVENVAEKVGEKLSDNQKSILKLITTNKYISAKEIAFKIGISQRKVETNIAKLKKTNT
jgi:predicted HTH transcriptional regulator